MNASLRKAEEALALQRSQPHALGPILHALRALCAAQAEPRARAFARDYALRLDAPQSAGDALFEVARGAPVQHFLDGEVVVEEGARSREMYVVVGGTVRVVRAGAGVVARLGVGQSVGEIAALGDTRRTATVIAEPGARLMVIDRKALGTLMNRASPFLSMARTLYRDRVLAQLIPPWSALAALPDEQRHALFRRFEPRTFDAGDRILGEGQPGAAFFIIASGTAKVIQSASGGRLELARLGPGEFFGEVSLLADVPVTATVQAVTPLTCFALTREAFSAVVATHPELRRSLSQVARGRLSDAGPTERLDLRLLGIAAPTPTIACPVCATEQPDGGACVTCGADLHGERDQTLKEIRLDVLFPRATE